MRGLTFVARAIATGIAAAALLNAPASAVTPPGGATGARDGKTYAPVAAPQPGNTFVEVNPNTAEPGTRVNIRASCDDGNNRQANVQSDAFGRAVVRPDNGFLTGTATIPGGKPPGTYGVTLNCQNNNNTANTTITVVNMSKPSQGPATGGGGTASGGMNPLILGGGLAVVIVGIGLGLVVRHRRTEMGS